MWLEISLMGFSKLGQNKPVSDSAFGCRMFEVVCSLHSPHFSSCASSFQRRIWPKETQNSEIKFCRERGMLPRGRRRPHRRKRSVLSRRGTHWPGSQLNQLTLSAANHSVLTVKILFYYLLTLHTVVEWCSEKAGLEKTVQVTQSSNQVLQMDCKKLQLSVTSMQRERDHERDEKEVAIHERDRAKSEAQRM